MRFPNATLTINRKTGTTTSIVATGVTARVRSIGQPQTGGDRPAAGIRFRVYLDPTVDARMGDSLTGWNPRNLSPAPELIVEQVDLQSGSLGHLEVTAIDRRSREV